MENKRIARTFVALLASALVVTGASALSANAATTGTASQATVSAAASSSVKASFSALSAYKIDLTQSFNTAVSVSEGKAAYTYKFGYKKDGKNTYVKTVKTSSPYVTYNYKFTEEGSYIPFVVVTDSTGASATYKLSTVTVKDLKVAFGKASANLISTEQAFQATASVGGGKTDYTYKFGYIKDGKTTYVKTAKTASPYMTYVYKFTKAGSYTPVLQIIDADGARRTVKQDAVTVKDFKVAFSSTSAYTIDKSQSFQANASLSNGSGNYTYRFGYIQDGKRTYLYNSDKTGSTYMTYNYKFPAAGTYVPFIEVMDGQNLYASNKLGTVTVKDIQIAFGKASANLISTEQAFQATASVGGGKTDYTYKFGYIKDGKTTYVKTAKTASPYMTYVYKFTQAGSYTPVLQIIDADGARKTVKQAAVTVKDFKVAFSSTSAYTIDKSQSFQANASLSNGSGNYTYRFGYIQDGKRTYLYNSDKTGSTYMTYNYKFPAAGTYVPFIEVMDGKNLYASSKLGEVTVKDIQIAFGKASSNIISTQQAFQATASVGGGKTDYTYKFGYIKDGKTTYVKTATTASPYMTYVYKFTQAGSYTPVLQIVDADGARKTVKQAAVTVKDFKVAFSSASAYTIKKSQSFQANASLSNGKGNYTYRFGYIQNGQRTYLYNSDKTGSTYMAYNYKFPTAGTYTLFVEVMDADNAYASATLSTVVTVTD